MKKLLLFFAAVVLAAGSARAQRASQPSGPQKPCGTERWPVKTLTDAQGDAIAGKSPVSATVAQLTSFAAPPHAFLFHASARRIAPEETAVYEVHAVMLGFKKETDQDYHIVVADPANLQNTMVVEIPAGACMAGADQAAWAALQANFAQRFGNPTAAFKTLASPVAVDVRGVGFFDFIHGQTGVAKNGFELHPVISITKETPQ